MMKTGMGGDGHVKGQCIPCPGCDDGFIEYGGRVCLNCGYEVESVDVGDVDANDWDELLDLVEKRKGS